MQNISSKNITLEKNSVIAQIIFEELKGNPDMSYSKQPGAAFQNEDRFIGLGSYKSEHEKQVSERIEKANEELDEVSQKIYGNVLALMGILVAVFSILTTNAEALRQASIDARYVITMNISMAFSIAILMGLILLFFNKAKNKILAIIYSAILIVMILFLISMGIGMI